MIGHVTFIVCKSDSPDCGCGFVSVERMKILLGLKTVGKAVATEQRQQITPAINFTCDGMITKWIIGANWRGEESLYPELQVWRNFGSDVYHKINGTFIDIGTQISNRIYEYNNFSPIPFLAGDILGVFLPRNTISRLRITSEAKRGPLNYYIPTANMADMSPYDTMDLQQSDPQLDSSVYHPLVTVEIGEKVSHESQFIEFA